MELGWSPEFFNDLQVHVLICGSLAQLVCSNLMGHLHFKILEHDSMRKREYIWGLPIGQKMKKSLISDDKRFTENYRRKCYTLLNSVHWLWKRKQKTMYLNHFTHVMRRNDFQSDKWDLALGKSLWVPEVPPEPMKIRQSCHQAWYVESFRWLAS